MLLGHMTHRAAKTQIPTFRIRLNQPQKARDRSATPVTYKVEKGNLREL